MKVLKTVLLLFAVSRLIIFGFLSIGQPDTVHYADNQLKLDNPILDRFILYDSYNYAQIASEGYSEDRLTAFFPLFPLIVKAFSVTTGMNVYWAGFVLSNFFLVCSLWLLDQLMEKKGLSERLRMLTLSALAFFPSSYFFSAFYTESFFLFLALLAFRFWNDEKKGAAYFIGGLAALTRIVGVWIPLAFFIERSIRRNVNAKDCVFAFVSGLMFCAYPLYLGVVKGDPLLFLNVQGAYYARISSIPFLPIYQDFVTSIKSAKIEPIIVFHLALFLIFVCYMVSTIRQRLKGIAVSWSELAYTFGLTLMPLSSIVNRTINISSHGYMRYFLTIFPLFIFVGKYIEDTFRSADKISGRTMFIIRKSIIYFVLIFIWIPVSVYILLILRFKGFIA
jgi:hypothetical protein